MPLHTHSPLTLALTISLNSTMHKCRLCTTWGSFTDNLSGENIWEVLKFLNSSLNKWNQNRLQKALFDKFEHFLILELLNKRKNGRLELMWNYYLYYSKSFDFFLCVFHFCCTPRMTPVLHWSTRWGHSGFPCCNSTGSDLNSKKIVSELHIPH